jgi:hypothetical protein
MVAGFAQILLVCRCRFLDSFVYGTAARGYATNQLQRNGIDAITSPLGCRLWID